MDINKRIESLEHKIKFLEELKESRKHLLKSNKRLRAWIIPFTIYMFVMTLLLVTRYEDLINLFGIGVNMFFACVNAHTLGSINDKISKNKSKIEEIKLDIKFYSEELEVLRKLGVK